jgi:acyl-coenzyme A synthetase/AMP-(fatty) acid ligase
MQKNAELVAIVDQNKFLSYADLFSAVMSRTEELKQAGITKGERVLIVGEKGCDMLSTILACLFCGVVYVPLESPIPEARIETIVANIHASACFDVKMGLKKFNSSTTHHTDDILIFYTSGSTGQPKGVRINEKNILNFVTWVQQQFSIRSDDRFCAHAPWHFDLSILDIYTALLSGASIHCVPPILKTFPYQMAQWLSKEQISVVYMVPTAIRHLVKHGQWTQKLHSSLRCILFAGEPYALAELQQLRLAFPEIIIANLYGPTETNVCTWCEIPDSTKLSQWTDVPIGHALPYFSLFVWDKNGDILNEEDKEGELICAGNGVSPGYINDAHSDNFFSYYNQLAYRTGDLVRITNKGLVFLGRKDRQIKLYGYRIDPHEIEAHLRSHPSIKDAAICVYQQQLIAFIVTDVDCSEKGISRYCLHYLPNYCCPKKFIFLEELPRTASEKIDYQKLLAREYSHEIA